MFEAAYAFLMPYQIGIGIGIGVGIGVVLKCYKCRVICSSGRRCLLLYTVMFFKFFNEINDGWCGFVLLFLTNKA
jgi:hypothetical protein